MDYVLEAARYVGIPWVKHGRTMSGADCYGVTKLVLSGVFNKELPDFDYDAETTITQALAINKAIEESTDIVDIVDKNNLEAGDILVFSYFGEESHVGVYLGSRMLIHGSRRKGSVLVSLSDLDGGKTIENRIQGALRCR